jgi:DNA-binding CsgD family transcriptional regulator
MSRTVNGRNAAGTATPNGERREDALDRRGANVRGLDLLTPRERDVLEALLTGRRIRGIAAARGLSTHTVRNHVKAILFKLEVHSQEELIALFADRV